MNLTARRTVTTLSLVLACTPLAAQPATREGTRSWSEEKCARYTEAWTTLAQKRGLAGLSADFQARHAAFIASGCTAPADVCPRSAAELEVANMLVMMAMNAGMASTFPPFACRKQP